MSQDDMIKDYIGQLERFKREKHSKEVNLDTFSLELGYSEDDIRGFKQYGQSCLQKAAQYLSVGQLGDAWRNADLASKILWDSVEPRLILGRIRLAQAKANPINNLYIRDAIKEFRMVLEKSENHPEALEGIKESYRMTKLRSLGALIVAVIIFVLVFVIIPVLKGTKEDDTPSAKTSLKQTTSIQENPEVNQTHKELETAGPPPLDVGFDVGSHRSLQWQLQQGDFKIFTTGTPSFSVHINGLIQAVGAKIYAISLDEVWFDADGQRIRVQSRNILDDFQAPLENGDVKPISLVSYFSEPAPRLQRIQLEVTKVDAEPKTGVNKLGAVRIEWPTPHDESYGLESFLRMRKVNVGLGGDVYTDFFVGIKNSGSVRLNELKLEPILYKNGNEIGKGIAIFAIMKNGPYLPSGSTTSVRFINRWRDQTNPAFFDELRIRVLSVE